MATVSRDFIDEFIQILRGEDAIWNCVCDNYKNKIEKNKSWNNLLKKYKEIDQSATIDSVKKKYKSLRASYRRELAKVKKFEKSGAGADDLYVPTLWYFNQMDFLRDQEIQLEGINTFDMENDTETEPKAKKPKKMENYFLEKAVSFLEQPKTSQEKDEATIYSESWAVGFRKMDERQKLFAKRLIDDAILQGQLGNLSSRSFVSLERQSLPHYMHPSIHYSHSNSHSPITTSTQYSGPRSPLSPAPFHYPQPGDSNIHIISNEIIQSPIQKLLNDPEYQDCD